MKQTPIKRRKGLRKQSPKQAQRLVRYYKVRNEFMAQNPFCQVCQKLGKDIQASVDCHHVRGRGKYLCDPKYFLAVCRPHHDAIHRDGKWARAHGFLISKFAK